MAEHRPFSIDTEGLTAWIQTWLLWLGVTFQRERKKPCSTMNYDRPEGMANLARQRENISSLEDLPLHMCKPSEPKTIPAHQLTGLPIMLRSA